MPDTPETPRCGAGAKYANLSCELPPGHAGDHQDTMPDVLVTKWADGA